MLDTKMSGTIVNSVKWSSLTEIATKLITPITAMILARLLTPSEFGVIATVNMVISFADVFTDAGFQKYIIQKKFNNEKELIDNANVAFWTNMGISCLLMLLIVIFSEQIASMVGSRGLGHAISFSSISLIFTSFSSIQSAILKKNFQFKVLFWVRILMVVIPVGVTLPLAFLGFSYWSVIIGSLVAQFSVALVLTIQSKWRPSFEYSLVKLKEMFSFSSWILVESILLWLTTNGDIFILSQTLSSYYIGLYKNSITLTNSIFNMIIAATSSVLLSALAATKGDDEQFYKLFYTFQKTVGIILIPLSVGVFLYQDLVTYILLGSQWKEASFLIGLYSLVNCFAILVGQYISLIFTAKGLPKLSVLSQGLQLTLMIPLLAVCSNFGFEVIVVVRCFIRLFYGFINLFLAKKYLKIPFLQMLKNLLPPYMSSSVMGIVVFALLPLSSGVGWEFFTIVFAMLIYSIVILCFPSYRKMIFQLSTKLIVKRFKKR